LTAGAAARTRRASCSAYGALAAIVAARMFAPYERVSCRHFGLIRQSGRSCRRTAACGLIGVQHGQQHRCDHRTRSRLPWRVLLGWRHSRAASWTVVPVVPHRGPPPAFAHGRAYQSERERRTRAASAPLASLAVVPVRKTAHALIPGP
jgi:hypothetical protein